MNSSHHLIYPDYPSTANIHDARHTGAGKTRYVRDKMNELIPLGESFIYISSSYDTLDGVAKKIDESNHSLIFKGKPQAGMCVYGRENRSLNEYIQSPFTCNDCGFRKLCKYQKQFDKLDKMKNSTKGNVIFTVIGNLKTVLGRVSKKHLHIIIDDTSLSDITFPTLTVSEESLIEALNYLNQGVFPVLVDSSSLLLEEKPENEIKKFVRENTDEYRFELKDLSERVSADLFSGKKIPNLKYLYSLLGCTDIHGYNQNKSKSFVIASSNLSKLQKYKIVYLNATADSNDRQTMSKFGNFVPFTKDIVVNPNYRIMQLVDARYPKNGLESPHCRIPTELDLILKNIQMVSNYIGKPPLIMTHSSIYTAWCKREDICLKEYYHEFEKYFGSNSKATNKYSSYPVSILCGTPILPGGYYIHPSRDCSIVKDGGYPESISKEDIDSDSQGFIHQMLGRTFRKDGNNQDCPKLAIVFSNIELGNVGAIVEKYYLRTTKLKEVFYSDLKKNVRQVYEEPIIAKACEDLDRMIFSQSPYEAVTLNGFSEEIRSKCGGLISKDRIAERIENKNEYVIEERIQPRNHKPAKYIVGKIGGKPEALATIRDVSCSLS